MMNMKFKQWILIGWLLCMINTGIRAQYNEKYRPQFHFSPAKGWVGDPDGLIYYKKQYHLFWWGHAVSNDLVHWKELPYPMQGPGGFHYFSGSMVVDHANTAGFGKKSLVAVYTMHTTDDQPEAQALSYSSNDGQSFQFYPGNPVLDIKSNSFRDPQVFWHTPSASWIMAAARPHLHQVSFYRSVDLKHWEHLSDFGPAGSYTNDWEVPDLFQLPVDGDSTKKKWVLSIGQGPNRMQYFLGRFDGRQFIADSNDVHWADYGTDFYAARSWRNEDGALDERTVWLGWMSNWSYARYVPSSWGKGFESIPRTISLKTFPDGIRLVQHPVDELKTLRREPTLLPHQRCSGVQPLSGFQPERNTYELECTLHLKQSMKAGLHLLVGDNRKLVIGYDIQKKQLYIDRTHCTDAVNDSLFYRPFAVTMQAPLLLSGGELRLHIFVDQSSVEVFANDGECVMSVLTYPGEEQKGIELFSEGGVAELMRGTAWVLTSIHSSPDTKP